MFESLYRNAQVSLVWRVALFAIDAHGRPLDKGELWATVDPLVRSGDISRAIREAKRRRLITPDSSASCLRSLLIDQEQEQT